MIPFSYLRLLSNTLRRTKLGDYWTLYAVSKKQCKFSGHYDPPCAYVLVACAIGGFEISADGEVISEYGDKFMPGKISGDNVEKDVNMIMDWLKNPKTPDKE